MDLEVLTYSFKRAAIYVHNALDVIIHNNPVAPTMSP